MRSEEVLRIGDELGKGSYGVVTAAELTAAGVDLSVVARILRRGSWTRLWRGCYLTAAHPAGPLVRAHAAVKHAAQEPGRRGPAPAPVVSGLAGAAFLGLRWVPEHQRVQVLVGPHVQRPSNADVLVRRTHDLAHVVTWTLGGVRIADPARLVVDGARECPSLRDVRGLVLGALADDLATPDALLALLDGGAVARTAWTRRAVLDAQRGAASPPEAEMVDGMLGCGHPFFVNAELRLHDRFLACPDVYLLGTGVGGEMDSKERHEQEDLLDDTLARHARADAHGLTLVHVTPGRYRADPAAFHARLQAAVVDRRRRGLHEPVGLTVHPRGPLLS